jgi:hypothetical protein
VETVAGAATGVGPGETTSVLRDADSSEQAERKTNVNSKKKIVGKGDFKI